MGLIWTQLSIPASERNIMSNTFKTIGAKASKTPVSYLQENAVLPWTLFLEEFAVELRDMDMT